MERPMQAANKGMEKDISCKWKGREAGAAILMSDKVGSKTKPIGNKDRRYRTITGSVQQEDTTLVNIYAPNPVPECTTYSKW